MDLRAISSALVVGVLTCASAPVWGQAHRAIIFGQVTDRTGAVIPGALVKIVQTETNVTSTTVTNESGQFEVPGLLPGNYRVEAGSRGFKTAAVGGVILTSAKRAEINVALDIGEQAESVTVQSARELLDTASADTNTVIDQRKVMDLPVGQGAVTYLYYLAPGASTATGVGAVGSVGNDVMLMQRGGSSTTRFNGSPTGTAEFTIDGAPNMQRGNGQAGGGVAFSPTPDMVQEVRVQTTTFDASVGHSGGSTIDVVLKSGTNQLHGTFQKYFRDKEWNANSWAGNRGGTPRPDFLYKFWGFTAGGPVYVPHLYNGKNRTFFFVGFDDWAGISPDLADFVTVPTPQQLKGDFSALLRVSPAYQIYDPNSAVLLPNGRIQRTPFAGNIIPANRINPISANFTRLWPEPNAAGTANGQLNFTYLHEPYPRKLWSLPMRFDHVLTPSQKLFTRLVISNTRLPRSTYFTHWEIPVWTVASDNRELAVGDVWSFSPGFVGDFRASVMRFSWNSVPIAAGQIDYKDYGLDSLTSLLDTRLAGLPTVTVAGFASPTNIQGSQQVSETRVAAAHFTRIVRAHSLRWGADLRWYIDNRGSQAQASISFSGSYSIGPLDTSPAPPLGAGLSDFLLGRFASAQITQPPQAANLSTYQGLYFQDDWKITRRLTLNVGIRYEREGAATERYNRNLAGFDFSVDNPIAQQAIAAYALNPIPGLPASQFRVRGGLLFAGVGGNPRAIYNANNRNFAPRIGAAFQLRPATVLRAGYGMYFVPYGQRFYASEGSVPGFTTNTLSFSSPDGVNFTRTLDNPFPTGLVPPVGSSAGLRTFLGQSISIPALRRNPNAYNQRWQFSIQQRVRSSARIEARYVGNHTVRMPIARSFNALPNSYLSTSQERDQARIDYLSTRIANPFFGIPDMGGSLATATTTSYSALLTPFPAFGSITAPVSQGASWYQALQVEFEKQFGSGFTVQTSYTWSKTIDALTYLNAADPLPEKVISDVDRPNIWRLTSIWELPFGKGRRFGNSMPTVLNYVLGGWQIQGITSAQSGVPIAFGNVLFRGDIKNIGAGVKTPSRLFNVDAGFERGSTLQLSSNVRTFPSRLSGVRYSPQFNTDFSVLKNARIAERLNVQFRGEAYNLFNQYFIYTGADTNPVSSAFGSSIGSSGPRTLQLGLKVIF